MCPPIGKVTKEGYDLQFGTNVLGTFFSNTPFTCRNVLIFITGHYYLTTLLLPVLKMGARDSPDHVARVINTSSQIHVIAKMNYDTFTDTAVRRKQDLNALYSQSKFVRYPINPYRLFENGIYRERLSFPTSWPGAMARMELCHSPYTQVTLPWEIFFSSYLKKGLGSLTTDLGRHISPFVRRIVVRKICVQFFFLTASSISLVIHRQKEHSPSSMEAPHQKPHL